MVGRDDGDDGDDGPLRGLARELPLLASLGLVVTGLLLGALVRWRAGALLVGAGVVLAAVLRLVLPVRRSGLLVVRSRRIDVAVLLVLGVALVVLASSVPQP